MSQTLLEPEPQTADVESSPASVLEDRIPPHLQLSRRTAGTVLGLGLVYFWFCLKPLWHTDLWGHLAYGRYLWTQGAMPATEPLMPLARGVPFVDTAWLSQLIGYGTYEALGIAGLQGLTAVVITAITGLFYQRLFTHLRSAMFAWLGVGCLLWLNWPNLSVARPQLAGLLGFTLILHRLTSRRPRSIDHFLVPFSILLWANLHGSFVMGLGLIAAFLAGRMTDLVYRTGSFQSWVYDASLRRWLVWLQLSAVAALINPWGLGLYAEVLSVGQNTNLQSLTEWHPLNIRALHGLMFVAVSSALIVVYRWTPRRIATWEPLLLLGLGIASLWSARFMVWWSPVAALLLAQHTHAVCRRWSPWHAVAPASPRNGKWSVVTVGLVWIFLAYSPLGMRLLHHKDPVPNKALSSNTPLGIVAWLNEHPPQGQVFNPYEWGDYLQWAGPDKLQIFLNSQAHLVPAEVWSHYLAVMDQTTEGPLVLDRYGVNTLILDAEYRANFIRRMKENADWTLEYEDHRGAVFQRKQPI